MRAQFRQLTAAAIMAVAVIAILIPATTAGASAAITFSVYIGSPGGCVTVLSGPDNKTITLTWRDANGALKGEATQTSPDIFFFCDTNLAVEAGDRLKATDGSYTRKFTVPELTLLLDRVTDTYYGTGPAHRTVRLEVAQGDVGIAKSIRVGADGNYLFHSQNLEIYGGDSAYLSWKSPKGDRVSTSGVAAQIVVTLDRANFSGYASPGADVDIDLQNGSHAVGSATADSNGSFLGKFRSAGHLRPVEAGDHLTAPSLAADADWIVPQIDGTADASTDVVSGQCHDNGTFTGVWVELYRTGHRRGYTFHPEGDGAGSFSFDFKDVGDFYADPANVKHGDQIVIQCVQTTGDIAQLKFIVP